MSKKFALQRAAEFLGRDPLTDTDLASARAYLAQAGVDSPELTSARGLLAARNYTDAVKLVRGTVLPNVLRMAASTKEASVDKASPR